MLYISNLEMTTKLIFLLVYKAFALKCMFSMDRQIEQSRITVLMDDDLVVVEEIRRDRDQVNRDFGMVVNCSFG